ncbi:MAG TPA: glucose-6-phosphate isomerase [Humidesulfovibrio sp.]|uniref:glucose-6-phosphate isomerase n=1 Tax=Humidesulfovibrio sp. TaxID=2910988 RepID=UPI002BD1D3EF|nr:glucose-6-phosphate isomerase [Humidesulfovibrio sp.]HWR02992.1 glucose-6-phosphate isomerase [Humidesulfovibrio sp.]
MTAGSAHKDVLDWTNARWDRLESAPALRARAAEMAQRLAAEVAAGKLPFLSTPFMPALELELADLESGYLKQFKHMLLLGIGGSALGARALQKAFAPGQDLPGHTGKCLWILDNVDPAGLEAHLCRLRAQDTLVYVVSKSGDTIETIGQYFLVKQWLKKELPQDWKDHLLLNTDEQKGYLRQEATQFGMRTLPVPDNLGGRYSAISAVGLVPAAFLGMDWRALVKGFTSVAAPLADPKLDAAKLAAHPSFEFALWGKALMDAGYSELITFYYIPAWCSFADWFAQLWAESLGKGGQGSQPIPAVGVTDQHSVNQMFLDGPRNKACLFVERAEGPQGLPFPADMPGIFDYLQGKRFGELLPAEALGTRMALCKNEVPLLALRLGADDAFAAGKMMALLGAATLLTGWLMGINPVDQPAVELGKRLAKARLGAAGLAEEKADLLAFTTGNRDERGF